MTLPENRYAVLLHRDRVGTLHQRGDHTRFVFSQEYLDNRERAILGLRLEENLSGRHAAALRLPPWFSNLLPEGKLRDWIADDRGVSADREMELLVQVGHDLPGAVRILACDDSEDSAALDWSEHSEPPRGPNPAWDHPQMRFSLAGIALKFSMLAENDRLTLPAFGLGGDWIVKLPDRAYGNVPRNEHAMMSLASAVGIDVPEVRLYHRDQLDNLPSQVWPGNEELAYAVRRFDRDDDRVPIHIEDLAQVRGVYPNEKYNGNYETAASLVYRRHDIAALREFARRLAFTVLISNGDAHLKNWSLIYRDPRRPSLAPAYDLVSTSAYMGDGETLGVKFTGSRRFTDITVHSFDRLEKRLEAYGAGLADIVADLVERVRLAWPEQSELLADVPELREHVSASIEAHSRSLLAGSGAGSGRRSGTNTREEKDGQHVAQQGASNGRDTSDETRAYLMVIGDRDALAWVLSTQQTAFPAARRGQVSGLEAGDELLIYTTRGCFGNPTRDKGRVIARATVTGPIVHDENPVRFGERSFPLRCPLRITELAPFGEGVVLADHVEVLHVFPDPSTWSVRLRRPLVSLDAHDHRYLTTRLDSVAGPLTENLEGYTRQSRAAGNP